MILNSGDFLYMKKKVRETFQVPQLLQDPLGRSSVSGLRDHRSHPLPGTPQPLPDLHRQFADPESEEGWPRRSPNLGVGPLERSVDQELCPPTASFFWVICLHLLVCIWSSNMTHIFLFCSSSSFFWRNFGGRICVGDDECHDAS